MEPTMRINAYAKSLISFHMNLPCNFDMSSLSSLCMLLNSSQIQYSSWFTLIYFSGDAFQLLQQALDSHLIKNWITGQLNSLYGQRFGQISNAEYASHLCESLQAPNPPSEKRLTMNCSGLVLVLVPNSHCCCLCTYWSGKGRPSIIN